MVEIVSRNSCIYARLLMGRARHVMLNARQKEVSPYHISPQQAYLLFILHSVGHKATLPELGAWVTTIFKIFVSAHGDAWKRKKVRANPLKMQAFS